MKILIVDDNFASRKLMRAYLEPHGSCTLAADGVEAFNLFSDAFESKVPFDLICMDIMMPELDGSETLKKIREFERRAEVAEDDLTKVIMISALDERKEIVRFFNDGCAAYLIKPIDVGQLTRTLAQLGLISEE